MITSPPAAEPLVASTRVASSSKPPINPVLQHETTIGSSLINALDAMTKEKERWRLKFEKARAKLEKKEIKKKRNYLLILIEKLMALILQMIQSMIMI